MEKITSKCFEVKEHGFMGLGIEIERLQKIILELDYGHYGTDSLDLESKMALKALSGMQDWQWKHNKGIRLGGAIHISVEIYEMHELQKRIDEFQKQIDW